MRVHFMTLGKNGGDALAIQSIVYLKEEDMIDVLFETGNVYDQTQNPY